MHCKQEALEELVAKKIRDPADFEWLKQSRFAWRSDRETVIGSICDVDFEYSFEYLGIKERLVITPLTDVCYIALSQALGMFLGGAPAGPAGTGQLLLKSSKIDLQCDAHGTRLCPWSSMQARLRQ